MVVTVPVGRRVRYELADPRLAGALAQLASLVLVVAAAGEPCGPEDYACAESGADGIGLNVRGVCWLTSAAARTRPPRATRRRRLSLRRCGGSGSCRRPHWRGCCCWLV